MRKDVIINAPIAVAGTSVPALPLARVLTAEDENVILRADIRRLESEALTRDVAIETIGTLLACAITQLLEGYDVNEIVWERELVRRMQAQKPHVEVRETIGGDTAAKLTFREGVSIGIGNA